MRILVTGHLGYIGTVMVPMLLEEGHAVRGCDSDLYARCTFAAGGPLANNGFHPTFFRSATAFGLSPRQRFDVVLNNLVAWAMTTGHIHLKSDGSPWRPLVHIEDISRAFIAALQAPVALVSNQVFN